MIQCNEKCSIFQNCKDRKIGERCIYDIGESFSEDDDEFIEKTTY